MKLKNGGSGWEVVMSTWKVYLTPTWSPKVRGVEMLRFWWKMKGWLRGGVEGGRVDPKLGDSSTPRHCWIPQGKRTGDFGTLRVVSR